MCLKSVKISAFCSNQKFYKEFAGTKNKTETNHVLFNQMMTIYVTKLWQRKKGSEGNEYAPSSLETKLKRLFSCFEDKGIKWKQHEFGKKDDWLSVLNTRINDLRKSVPGYGIKKVAEIDEEGDNKFLTALEKGILKPFNDTDDLMRCIIALLGKVLGYRGGKEIALAL